MRSFFTSLTILLIMTGLIIWNSVWVTGKLDNLLDICEKIESGSPALEELTSGWRNCRNIVSLSINHSEIDRAENAICGLLSYPFGSDDFMSKLRDLENALSHISDAQKFRLDNVL